MRNIWCVIWLVVFTSCGSVNYFNIETYNPAEITFPPDVNKVLIVNNAVSQPPETVCESLAFGILQDSCEVEVDSVFILTVNALGSSIMESDYFYDVLLYNMRTRSDNGFLVDKKLTLQQINDLCAETGADAVISIDRLLFKIYREIETISGNYMEGRVRAETNAVVRAYLPERTNPLATVLVEDSLIWSGITSDWEDINWPLLSSADAINTLAVYIGEKVQPYFVPYWQEERRWLFTDFSTQWKEAAAFSKSQNWEEAALRWKALYDRSNKWDAKAKAASNLALSYEMAEKLEEAYEWAKISAALFKENTAEDDQNRKLLTEYEEALTNRVLKDRKLNKQIIGN